jgi:hypothetical protein
MYYNYYIDISNAGAHPANKTGGNTMKAQISYHKNLKGTYQVVIEFGPKTRRQIELPFGSRIFDTKKEARRAVKSAYENRAWNLNHKKNTIDVDANYRVI